MNSETINRAQEARAELLASDAAPSATVVAPRAAAKPADPEREQLLHEVQRGRDEVASAAARLRGPVQTLETARDVVVFTSRSLRWVALAGNVVAIAMCLKKGRRPPLTLLAGISWQLFNAFSQRGQHPRTAISAAPRSSAKPRTTRRPATGPAAVPRPVRATS